MRINEYIRYAKDNPRGYWFKAKLFGWGWTPAKWQGWATLLGFIILIVLNSLRLGENPDPIRIRNFFGQTIILVLLLIFVCWKKGEKPRWQWGVPEKYKSAEQDKK